MDKTQGQAHQGSRDSRVANEEVCIGAAGNSHESAHLLVKEAPTTGPSGVDVQARGRW